jgi:hypothetical protein
MKAWIIIGVALVGCEHGQVPGLAFRNPGLNIRDVQQPIDPNSPSGDSRLMIEVQVVEADLSECTPLDGSFGGTFRGAPMTVTSYGDVEDGFCRPTVAIDPLSVTPADEVITVFDSSASISATLEAGVLDARTIDASSLDLVNNVSFDIRWSHPDDLATSSLTLSFRESVQGPCNNFEGCSTENFSAFGSINTADPALVTFTPFFSTGAQNGEVVIRAGTTAGEVGCEALSCTFELQHLVVVPASATL